MKYGAIYPSLKGRTVLVTGGGSGIGESIVEHFAAQGSKVAFIDIKEKESKALVARLRRKRRTVHFEHCDLTDIPALQAAVKSARKALGPITVLVNNAAHDERHTLEQVTSDYFDERIAMNLKHQLFTIQAVVGDMKKAKNGAIVNMGSTAPGWIMTERQKSLWVTPEALVELMKDQCLQRTLDPADIARAVLFFASDESSAATNQSFVFDGGWL